MEFDSDDIEAGTHALDVAGKVLPKTMAEIDTIGESVFGLFNTIFTPISLLNYKLEYIREDFKTRLNKKVQTVPEEKRCESPRYIVGPALENLKYSYDEEYLRNLYINLIASSMDTDNRSELHPSFVQIIQALSYLDAVVFEQIYKTKHTIIASEVALMIGESRLLIDDYPLYFVEEFEDVGDPHLVSSAFSNLFRLGLVSIESEATEIIFEGKILRNKFIRSVYKKYKTQHVKIRPRLYNTVGITLTDFGKIFGKICLSK